MQKITYHFPDFHSAAVLVVSGFVHESSLRVYEQMLVTRLVHQNVLWMYVKNEVSRRNDAAHLHKGGIRLGTPKRLLGVQEVAAMYASPCQRN